MDSSDLDVVLVSDGLEFVLLLGELGQSNVHGGSEGSSQVGGAGCDVSEVAVVGELCDFLDVGAGS